jgi:adenylate cyclase
MAAQQFTGAAIQPHGKKGIRFLGHTIPFDDSQSKTVLIGRWGPSPAATISALSVLRGKLDAELVRDKLVLIGQGSDAARDRHLTPLFRPAGEGGTRLRIPGTQIHAAAIDTLLSGSAIGVVPNSVLWAASLLLFTCAIWLLLRVPLSYGLLATGCGFLLVYGAAQLLFSLNHLWLRFSYLEVGLALCVPVSTGYRYFYERFLGAKALAEREQVMGLFSRYVSPDVAREIWERRTEVVLAGEERTATVVFSDIRSFTALTAGKPSDVVLQWLNEYLTAMDDIITQEHGFLNKFIGDGLMILFGVPLSSGGESDAVSAVRCSQRMVEGVAGLNRLHAGDPRFPRLKIGVGIHTGTLTCGNIGSSKRLEYSVIGETVNLASRLESLTKEFQTDIVISEATYLAVRNRVDGLHDLGPSPVRGFDRPIHLYSIDSGTRAPARVEEDLSSRANI